ncbi:N-6 DNA methylase [Deinococcus soli (ex Cha et al. 2016)]|uniref:N-6 DNA methylase n=1 Tax=Deinococcus soli (ex Cha et al. 2016) TaxID=1309411 RepID=UPI00361A1CD1
MATSTPKAAFTEYVKAIRKAHGKGTPENTYLPILSALLGGLLPGYHLITHPSKDEQGLPDFALREKDGAENIALGEAEALDTPLAKNTHGLEQAQRYAKQAPTLLTNFHEFIVLDGDTELGRYSIPHEELTGTVSPATLAKAHLEPLTALLDVWASARGSLTRPQKIAGLLAYYARQALTNIESLDDDALAPLRRAMEDALGTSFTLPEPQPRNDGRKSSAERYQREREKWLKKQAELSHFFRSSLVQALFYGLFAGWVTAARTGKGHLIDRENIADDLHIPVITLLLDEVNTKRKLTQLDLTGPVSRAIDLLRRVDAEPFLQSFQNGEAVTYFYEPFLDAFDPQLRKDLGIWYTPHEIIRYQITHVHQLLIDQLNIPQGLLDPNVTILDPATGTGGYLLELARFMRQELKKQGRSRIGAQIKQAFQTRIYGFELLPAPFAIAHLQLGLMLAEAGAPLGKSRDGQDERVNVLLTNSLNGWTPRTTKPDTLYNELAHEQELTDNVKHTQKIMVMIGNPPTPASPTCPTTPKNTP